MALIIIYVGKQRGFDAVTLILVNTHLSVMICIVS